MKNLLCFLFCIGITNLIIAQDCEKEVIATVGGTKVWQLVDNAGFYFFTSKMAIDADGSPRAYHPENIGLDDLKHAGYEGNWWGIATDNNGNPIIQDEDDPNPGYYVSTTSLCDRRYTDNDPRRYVDSEKIPFIVLPPQVSKLTNTDLGDFGYVYNTNNKKSAFVIFADTGPRDKIGEGSIYLAKQLGINANARSGGQADGVIYIIFPLTGAKQPRSLEDINKKGQKYFDEIGIEDILKYCFD